MWLQVVGLLTLFRNMDTDNDGVVSLDELCFALDQRGVHVTDEHAKVRDAIYISMCVVCVRVCVFVCVCVCVRV